MLAVGLMVGGLRFALDSLGLHGLAWKLRRLDFRVRRSDLVLDVGSGSKPNPFADVLLEADPEGAETNVGRARGLGRALVWGNAQQMPFRRKVFDHALCFHVLEHVADPGACLAELERVAKRGYIETPNELFDFICPYFDHRNRISFDGVSLRVHRKSRWNVERFQERYGATRASDVLQRLLRDPSNLHVQYRWAGRIDWMVSDEVLSDGWPGEAGAAPTPGHETAWLNSLAATIMQRRKLTEEQLVALLRCVECSGETLMLDEQGQVHCCTCHRVYRRVEGYLDFR